MRRNRIEILLVGITVLALSAGVVAGMLASRLPASGSTTIADPSPIRATLSDELALNADQRGKMRDIWENVRSTAQQCFRDAEEIQRQRDNEILTLLSDKQKAEFEKISRKYSDKFSDTENKRQKSFQEAVDRTRKILNDEQRARYDQILHERFPNLPTTRPEALNPQ